MQESQKELDRLTATVDRLGHEMERLNSEILYWKSETDKRKQQLGEYLLDDPCDPGDDSLWQQLVAREVEEAREKMGGGSSGGVDPEVVAMALITELVRDKQEALVYIIILLLIITVGGFLLLISPLLPPPDASPRPRRHHRPARGSAQRAGEGVRRAREQALGQRAARCRAQSGRRRVLKTTRASEDFS